MEKVISKDGTTIAFDQSGKGPAIILVVGAFNDRATGAPLAGFLERHFTVVFNYDRRGRGESSDTGPYAIEREIEDLDALIAQACGSACVFGYSSGATLALRAAAHGLAISQLALYEPPPTGAKAGQLAPQLTELIAAGRRGDAVELFQTEAAGTRGRQTDARHNSRSPAETGGPAEQPGQVRAPLAGWYIPRCCQPANWPGGVTVAQTLPQTRAQSVSLRWRRAHPRFAGGTVHCHNIR